MILLVVFCIIILSILGILVYTKKSVKTEKYENIAPKNISIIIPFAEFKTSERRSEQLQKFIEIINTYPFRNRVHVIIAEQIYPKNKFNKGKLLNAIVDFLTKTSDIEYIIFNDVDMIPDEELFEQYFKTNKTCSFIRLDSDVHKKGYKNNPKYPLAGGIFGIHIKNFMKINGFPNNFWGWGGEDDIISERVTVKNGLDFIRVDRGEYISTDIYRINGLTDKIQHLKHNNLINDKIRYTNKNGKIVIQGLNYNDEDWMLNGLNSVKYKLIRKIEEEDNLYRYIFDLE